jgi:hypothetical protein
MRSEEQSHLHRLKALEETHCGQAAHNIAQHRKIRRGLMQVPNKPVQKCKLTQTTSLLKDDQKNRKSATTLAAHCTSDPEGLATEALSQQKPQKADTHNEANDPAKSKYMLTEAIKN